MAYNRHMPRAVILGPSLYGGSNISTYFHEQSIQHIERFIRHIHHNCFLGKLFRILLAQYQLYIGFGTPILTQPSNRFPYSEKHYIQYLWEVISSIDLTLQITNTFIPHTTRIADKFIMDCLVEQNLKPHHLCIINNVRLWLRVSTVGDLFDSYTGLLYPLVTTASTQQPSNLQWPCRRKPLPSQVTIWKDNIYHTFVKGH